MKTVYVEFTVKISESEFGWAETEQGSAMLKLEMPEDSVSEVLDVGASFCYIFETALTKYQNRKDKETDKNG